MDTVTLLALGAAGGSVRGLVDAYHQTMSWRAARHTHRSGPSAEAGEPPPPLGDYFDPLPDTVALLFHALLGGVAALLFGTSGQITGAYAALAVGISAPALLVQLGQFSSVNEAVTGTAAPQAANPVQSPAPGPAPDSPADTPGPAPSASGQGSTP
ncbi:hypothetical protein [Streptomyces sp. JJ36]|uniref:hypothetical protein n=1 Tax=Streptomyces sp. JJ36 TaxID=2736645 RepID=UPI001F38B384|nr:hypothetical protein [Streptomyces sp. JJ36]MCF6522101.1 hypothetical protein [Streptomyces sp. JJ36]